MLLVGLGYSAVISYFAYRFSSQSPRGHDPAGRGLPIGWVDQPRRGLSHEPPSGIRMGYQLPGAGETVGSIHTRGTGKLVEPLSRTSATAWSELVKTQLLQPEHSVLMYELLRRVDSVLNSACVAYWASRTLLIGAYLHSGLVGWTDSMEINVFRSDLPLLWNLQGAFSENGVGLGWLHYSDPEDYDTADASPRAELVFWLKTGKQRYGERGEETKASPDSQQRRNPSSNLLSRVKFPHIDVHVVDPVINAGQPLLTFPDSKTGGVSESDLLPLQRIPFGPTVGTHSREQLKISVPRNPEGVIATYGDSWKMPISSAYHTLPCVPLTHSRVWPLSLCLALSWSNACLYTPVAMWC